MSPEKQALSSTAQGHYVTCNGLRHYVREWEGNPSNTAVLLHGYLDQGQSFGTLADALHARGMRVLVPDFRGHGRSDWVGAGGYYHFPDYVADLAGLLAHFGLGESAPGAVLVGHSMGGSVATLYAGTFPTHFHRLVLLEGMGPPGHEPDEAPLRMQRWLQGLAKNPRQRRRELASLSEAVARLRSTHGEAVSQALLERFAAELSEELPSGARLWRFDPLHQTTSPARFDPDVFHAYAKRIASPVLLVEGGRSPMCNTAWSQARRGWYARARVEVIPEAGHMLHWTHPHEVLNTLADFVPQGSSRETYEAR